MASLNIKDPRVHALATELAQRRGSTKTAAIRSALEDALATEVSRQTRASLDDLMAIARRSAAKPAPFLTDDDLYDEHGLPR